MFTADSLPGPRAELRADDAAHHQHQRQHCVDEVIGYGMQHGRHHHRHQCQCHRGADHRRGGHPQHIDHDRDQQEAAADAHDGAEKADQQSDGDHRDHR